MVTFLIISVVGLVILAASFFLEGVFDVFDLDFGDGYFSATSLSAFVAAFGLGGVVAISGFDATTGSAIGTGFLTGLLVFAVVGAVTRLLRKEYSEGAPSSRTIVGVQGTVVTPIVGDSYGEVSLSHGGHLTKMGAIADNDIPRGARVRVVAALSPTSVKVETVA